MKKSDTFTLGSPSHPKEKRSHIFPVLIFFACLCCHPACGAEESRLNQITQKKEIRVGPRRLQPFSYFNPKTNQYEGNGYQPGSKIG